MGKYTEFWKEILKELYSKAQPTRDLTFEKDVDYIKQFGDRPDSGHACTILTWTGKVVDGEYTKNSIIDNLIELIDNQTKFKNIFPGELKIRIHKDRKLKATYTPISYDFLIEKYSHIQETDAVRKEIYKWKLIKKFQENWKQYSEGNISFVEFFINIDFSNLIYPVIITVYRHVLKEKPEEFKTLINLLFNESLSLDNRIKEYTEGFASLYYSLDGHGKNTFQDDRTIATFLTFRYPEKYTFFKDSFYSKLCRGLGINSAKPSEKIIHYYKLVDDLLKNYLLHYPDIINIKNSRLDNDCYIDINNTILAQDVLYKTLEIGEEKDSTSGESTPIGFKENGLMLESNMSLNQILFGPPGTGKTYHSIDLAVQIANPELYQDGNHKANKQVYDDLVSNGQIVFTTFHQSMNYEDFVEGIKPLKPDESENYLKYDVVPGIFKSICDNAKSIKVMQNKIDWESVDYYKMSLGGRSRLDLHEWLIDNNLIGLGWGGENDLSKFDNYEHWNEYREAFAKEFPELVKEKRFHVQAAYVFQKMKINDIVVVSKGNHIIDAIGVVKGNYFWDDNNDSDYFHFRKVEWLAKNLNTSPQRFFNKQISQMTIYRFSKEDVKIDAFKELTAPVKPAQKPYVLVIDEINRGNISQIFGELISLIEEDKRIGNDESLEVTLPYSREKFGVPPNLYIIGTMNTADRSIEALDTALRRRFTFKELEPNPSVIKNQGKADGGFIGEINLVLLLQTINKRIEKLIDKDHMIGHSYFMNIDNHEELKKTFSDKIIPLLEEYFFNDLGKIGLILGKSFVQKLKNRNFLFAEFDFDKGHITDLQNRPMYKITKPEDWNFIDIYVNELNHEPADAENSTAL